jgi:hypothetical protein
MDRDETIYRKPLHELNLTGLAELCANVSRNRSAERKQTDMAYALRQEWVRLYFDGLLDHGMTEVEKSLQKRMAEFLAQIPSWMWSGL